MIQTIIEILVFQLLFLVVYDVFLKNETFFNANRIYLIVTPLLSLVLPFIKLEFLRTEFTAPVFQQLPTVFIGEVSAVDATETVSSSSILSIVWIIGTGIAFILLAVKLLRLYKLKQAATRERQGNFNIYHISNSTVAFSFFNAIYIGDAISQEKSKLILDHELIHVKEKHSIDLFVFEILRISLWFNPLVYLFQKRLQVLHEYIADTKVSAKQSRSSYYQDLLSEVFQTENFSFTNTFFNHSLIKKRIIMLHKSKSNSILKLKYLVLIPMIAGLLIYTSCESDTEAVTVSSLTTQIEELEASIDANGNLNETERLKLISLRNKLNTMQQDRVLPPPPPPPNGTETIGNENDVPFAVIDRVPTFQDCTGSNSELKTCTIERISAHIVNNINKDLFNALNLEGAQRIYVAFKVDKNGDVVNVRARSPHLDLSNEAKRVVSTLPKMIPGQQAGKNVGVLYSLPIVYEISE